MAKKKVNVFDDLRGALQDALAYERGAARSLRVSELAERPKPMSSKDVTKIRKSRARRQC